MSETARVALDLLIRIIIYSGYVAAPIIILILVMYQYEKYKKWKDKETRDAERIIVKMNDDIVKTGSTINLLTSRETELKLSCESYETRIKELKVQAGEQPTAESEEVKPAISEVLNIKQLQALARERHIKGFSRMSKDDLIKKLGSNVNVVQM